MIALDSKVYFRLEESVEVALDKADFIAEIGRRYYTHEGIFGELRERINGDGEINSRINSGDSTDKFRI